MSEKFYIRSEYHIVADSALVSGKRNSESECLEEFGAELWARIRGDIEWYGSALAPPYRPGGTVYGLLKSIGGWGGSNSS